MAIFLLKKSYQASNQKEIGFKDLWGSHGVFTTIRLLGKPGKLILFKSHFKGLIKSLKKYKIYSKNIETNINRLIYSNINKNINYDHLFRIALTKKFISISIRKRLKPKKDFELKLINYRRIDPETKNLYYKDLKKFDEIMLIGSGKIVTPIKYIKEINWKSKNNLGYKKVNKYFNF